MLRHCIHASPVMNVLFIHFLPFLIFFLRGWGKPSKGSFGLNSGWVNLGSGQFWVALLWVRDQVCFIRAQLGSVIFRSFEYKSSLET